MLKFALILLAIVHSDVIDRGMLNHSATPLKKKYILPILLLIPVTWIVKKETLLSGLMQLQKFIEVIVFFPGKKTATLTKINNT